MQPWVLCDVASMSKSYNVNAVSCLLQPCRGWEPESLLVAMKELFFYSLQGLWMAAVFYMVLRGLQ